MESERLPNAVNSFCIYKSFQRHYFSTYVLKQVITFFLLLITLQGCSSRDKPAPVTSVYGSVPLKERVKNNIHGSEYIVKSGETLYSIAWRANSDVRQIANLNKLSPPYNIYPNQKLILVAKSTPKSVNARSTKHSSNNLTKSSNQTSKNASKNTLASTKKPRYGENVTKKKTVQNDLHKESFSKKISHWKWPVKGKVIAKFSSKLQGNKGLDIAGRRGTKISASANGKVVYAGSALTGYGKLIIIKHNDDYLSAYAHNDTILVKEQQYIKAGETIAKMGDTDAERVMLHFEVRFRGKSVDPLKYLPKQ